MIELTPGQLRELITKSMELAVKKTLIELGMLKPYMSKSEAYKIYGRKQVDRWLEERLITKIKDGTNSSKIRLSRMELEIVAMTSNRTSWFAYKDNEEENRRAFIRKYIKAK